MIICGWLAVKDGNAAGTWCQSGLLVEVLFMVFIVGWLINVLHIRCGDFTLDIYFVIYCHVRICEKSFRILVISCSSYVFRADILKYPNKNCQLLLR